MSSPMTERKENVAEEKGRNGGSVCHKGIGCTKITKAKNEGSISGNVESRSYLEKRLVFCFGSYVAAQLLLPFGEENILSSSELKQAEEIATRMVIQYGWGPDDSPTIYHHGNSVTTLSMGNHFEYEMAAKVEKNDTIAQMWTPQGWDLMFRRALNDWEVGRVADLLHALNLFPGTVTEPDKPVWRLHSRGVFTVKSCYWERNTNHSLTTVWPWKLIWKIKVPLKVACFTWLESEREDQKKTGGKISLLAYGGHYGRKGMGDVLKEREKPRFEMVSMTTREVAGVPTETVFPSSPNILRTKSNSADKKSTGNP
ncbi:hypothetical protein MTR67_007808 [Solanum verrucosum]|uniref:Uncharacterized protein n=1 Tax=Solanum verrucosum TaxID=315347 RepID=A0AAF0TFS8_SOLVR|nr:hypothetical protein MTR67_007808 [Solanum verrucosum]